MLPTPITIMISSRFYSPCLVAGMVEWSLIHATVHVAGDFREQICMFKPASEFQAIREQLLMQLNEWESDWIDVVP